MAMRKVVTPSGRGIRGFFPSTKNQRMVAWESLLERDAIILFELSPGVVSYEEQPSIELYYDGSLPRRYYPDFALTLRNGSVAHVEVKPKKKLSNKLVYERLHLIAANYQRQSRQFWILTDDEIRKQPRLSNLTQCAYHIKAARVDQPPVWQLHELKNREDWTVEKLAKTLGGISSVFRLLASGLAFCDLSQPILHCTRISFTHGEAPNDSLYF